MASICAQFRDGSTGELVGQRPYDVRHVSVTCVMSHPSPPEHGCDVLEVDALCDVTLALE
jgi:hypothetical protein